MSGEHTVQDNTDSTDWATEGRERAEKKGKNRGSSILAKPIYFWKPFISTAHRGTLLPKPESCIHAWSRYCLSSGVQCYVSAEAWKGFGPSEVGGRVRGAHPHKLCPLLLFAWKPGHFGRCNALKSLPTVESACGQNLSSCGEQPHVQQEKACLQYCILQHSITQYSSWSSFLLNFSVASFGKITSAPSSFLRLWFIQVQHGKKTLTKILWPIFSIFFHFLG